MTIEKIIIRKPVRYKKVSHKLTFKELAFVYEHLKDDYGKVALKELGDEILSLEKQYAASFAEFAKIVKSSSNDYHVSRK